MSEIKLPEGLMQVTRDILLTGIVSREEQDVMIIMAKPSCEILRVDCQYREKDNHFELDIRLPGGDVLETSVYIPVGIKVIWIMGPCPIQTTGPQLTDIQGKTPTEYNPMDPELNRT